MAIKKTVTGQIFHEDMAGVSISPVAPHVTPALAVEYGLVICTTCSGCGWLFSTILVGLMKVATWLKLGLCPTCKGLGHL
jgi:hypothetical protein